MADYSSRNIGFVVDSAPVAAPAAPVILGVNPAAYYEVLAYSAFLEKELIIKADAAAGKPFYYN